MLQYININSVTILYNCFHQIVCNYIKNMGVNNLSEADY